MARKAAKALKSYELMDLGKEPEWDEQHDLEDSELTFHFSRALNWYNYNYTSKHGQDFLVKYMKSVKKHKKNADAVSALEPWQIGKPYGSLAIMALNGLEFPSVLSQYKDRFESRISELVEKGKEVLAKKKVKVLAKKKAPVVSIQERVRAVSSEHLGNIEGLVDDFVENNCKKKINLYDWLQKSGVKGGHMNHIIDYYKEQYAEMQEVLLGKDDDLNEGYAFLSKPRKKKLALLYASFIADSQEWQKNCRGKRKARKRKVRTPKELVKSFVYKKEDEDFDLESVKPVEIIGASQVWLFDTKTRFMYKYVSDVGMTVKGSTIKDFDPTQSFKKKVREMYCDEVLDDVIDGGKVKLRKALDSIKAKEVPVTGRVGKEMVIVRVMK